MAINKLDRIRAISAAMPILNQEAQARVAGGQAMQLQNLAKQAPSLSVRQVQAAAPAVQAQLGQQQLQAQAQGAQAQLEAAGAALQSQGVEEKQRLQATEQANKLAAANADIEQRQALSREEESSRNRLTDAEIASNNKLSQYGIQVDNNISFMSQKAKENLAQLGGDVKNKLFDSQLQFSENERGRALSNQDQLLKATIASAKDKNDLNVKLSKMKQDNDRSIMMLDQSLKLISTALERGYLDNKRKLDQESTMKLMQLKQAMEREIERKKNRAKNTGLIIGGLMTAAGAALIATPAGAPLIAAGLSTAAASQQ